MLAADMGFAAATTNPFTINIAQGIAELPLNSGIGLRMVFFVCCHDPDDRPRAALRRPDQAQPGRLAGRRRRGPKSRTTTSTSTRSRAARRSRSSAAWRFSAGILYGVQTLGWWMSDMAGGFFLMGLVAAAICGLSLAESSKAFVQGAWRRWSWPRSSSASPGASRSSCWKVRSSTP